MTSAEKKVERGAMDAKTHSELTARLTAIKADCERALNMLSKLNIQPLKFDYPPKVLGRKSKLDTDHELRDFVTARLGQKTMVKIARDVAENFPPERRLGKSAISDWWHRQYR